MYLKSKILSIALVMIGTVVSYGQGFVTRTNKPTKKKTEKNLNPINTKKHDIIQSNEEGSIKEKKDDRHLLELLDRDPHGTINGHEYVD